MKEQQSNSAGNRWALILGASSGFGEATALRLASEGYHIAGVHLDRRAGLEHVAELTRQIEQRGVKARYFNVNAAAEEKRHAVLEELSQLVGDGRVEVLLHSLAFGTLKPFVASEPKEAIDQKSMDMTLDVMAHSLVYWSQDLVRRKLLRQGGRIFALTSAGSLVVWKSYGAVSAAKSALESHCRQLAVELAPLGITANAIMAGVTDTPALRKIPGNEQMIEGALARHPAGRLTRPEDVANVIALFSRAESAWMTGNTIRVDGGETFAG